MQIEKKRTTKLQLNYVRSHSRPLSDQIHKMTKKEEQNNNKMWTKLNINGSDFLFRVVEMKFRMILVLKKKVNWRLDYTNANIWTQIRKRQHFFFWPCFPFVLFLFVSFYSHSLAIVLILYFESIKSKYTFSLNA